MICPQLSSIQEIFVANFKLLLFKILDFNDFVIFRAITPKIILAGDMNL